ncbi:MAG: hypothetical protein Kow00121_26180 [Elainellaceae cyanobacterium]
MTQPSSSQIIIFDTTMRDGELALGVKMNIRQKLSLAKLLEAMQVDVIEVGYPGLYRKDFDEIFMVAKQVKQSIVCGLASSKPDEIACVALAVKPAVRGRIHVYTPVHITPQSELNVAQTLEVIEDSIALARNYCSDIEWSAFNATRCEPDFLCRAIEVAIKQGATTINIPDTLGSESPETFSALIAMIRNRVPNIDRAIVSVHCHDDRGLAVANSIAALEHGARQIECSINGLGARQGNASLNAIIAAVRQASRHLTPEPYQTNLNLSLLNAASEWVDEIVGMAVK